MNLNNSQKEKEVYYIKKINLAENTGSLSIEVDGDGEIDFDVEVDYGYCGLSTITHTLTIADLESIIKQAKHQKEVWQAYLDYNL